MNENYLTLAILFGVSQLFAFLIDLIAWAVRKKHPARIEKSEDVSYPQYLTVFVWIDSRRFHGYKKRTYIRKGDNKYKKEIDRSVGGWIKRILINLVYILLIFSFSIAALFYAPDFLYTHHDLVFGLSANLFLVLLHVHLSGADTIARIELNKYLKAQSKQL